MADAHIGVAEGTDKNLQTFRNTIGGVAVDAEAVTLTDSAGAELKGQKAEAESVPVVLPASQITTLTPPAAITGYATSAKQDTLLTELQLKADLTETQPVSMAAVPTGGSTSAKQDTGNTSLNSIDGKTPDFVGTFSYVSGTLTSGNKTGSGACIGIRVFASGADGTFNIGGGNTITVRSGTGVDVNPMGNISNAVVNWVSGTLDVLITSLS